MDDIYPAEADDNISEALDLLAGRILAFAEQLRRLQDELERSLPPGSDPVDAGSSEMPSAPPAV
jgi:hypothetical protein